MTARVRVPEGWEQSRGGVLDLAAAVLVEAGWAGVFTRPPAAWLCAEPIVLTCGAWERDARTPDGEERGLRSVDVLVCREDAAEAEAACLAAERDLRGGGWEGAGEGWRCRVAAVDSDAPCPRGRDASGRWLWGFTLLLKVVRDLDG